MEYLDSSTVRVRKDTKHKLHSLDFVRKDTDNEIIEHLIDVYSHLSNREKDKIRKIIRLRKQRQMEQYEKNQKEVKQTGTGRFSE